MNDAPSDLVVQIADLYGEQGYAKLRAGKRRTQTEARSILRDAAEYAGVEVTTKKDGSGIIGVVKG